MPGLTPAYAIPYPLLTDRVTDGAAAIRATAEKVDTVLGVAEPQVLAARDAAVTDLAARRAQSLADFDAAYQTALANIQAASGDINTRVSKAGDTMTGDLGVPRLRLDGPTDAADALLRADSDGYVRLLDNTGAAAVKGFVAGPIFDGSQRVYSPNNPPPAGGAVIRQTIRGTVSTFGNANGAQVTIPAVNMAKAQLRSLGGDGYYGSGEGFIGPRLSLINTTTVRLDYRFNPISDSVASYEITEWS